MWITFTKTEVTLGIEHCRAQRISSSAVVGPATILWAWLGCQTFALGKTKMPEEGGVAFPLVGKVVWESRKGKALLLYPWHLTQCLWGAGENDLEYFDRNFKAEGALKMKPRISHMSGKGSTTNPCQFPW